MIGFWGSLARARRISIPSQLQQDVVVVVDPSSHDSHPRFATFRVPYKNPQGDTEKIANNPHRTITMPPRPAISGVQAALSTSTTATWRAVPATRCFSTTIPTREPNTAVPPESPHYIKVPVPPQSSETKLPPIRGHLPVPRKVFTRRDGLKPARISPDYVSSIKPKSASEAAGLPPANQHEARRRVLAESRRKSLAEGLQGLWLRKRQSDQSARDRSSANRRKNIAAAQQPERLDEVLTRPTVRASTAAITAVLPDPDRFVDAEKAKLEHEAKLNVKAEARRDALCQMYMAASNFIVDEAELEERVNVLFGDMPVGPRMDSAEDSIWSIQGAPSPLAASGSNFEAGAQNSMSRITARTQIRQKLVAEALTGGKL
ncbi:hypothetical protein V8F20_009170 [Naviculisporaceae sp. PSN 640]